MEKKEKSWKERHPNWNLCYYTYMDEFEGVSSLDEAASKCALRVLKRKLEDEIGFELSDEVFIAIFFKVINLAPARPIGAHSFHFGFVVPMLKLLDTYNLDCGVGKIFSFFNIRYCKNYNKRHFRNLLLHVPHSSTSFPTDCHKIYDDLDEEERLLIDYYTNELFVPQQESKNIMNVVFPYCRLYCDVERLINDPLEKDGLGISYNRWVQCKDGYGKSLRSFSGKTSAFALYADFHAEVAKKIVEMGEGTLLVDCHSFSSLPNLLNSNPPDIDICIGYNDDETCPNKVTIGNIVQYFKARGYKVGINEPFSNSKTFSVPVKYHSVMIEVNKRLYMNEQTLEKTEGFERLKQDIQALYTDVLLLR